MILKTSNQILSQAKASLTSIDVVASAIIGFALGMVFSVGRSFYGSLGLMSFKDSWLWIRGFCYGCAAAIAIARYWFCGIGIKTAIKASRYLRQDSHCG